MPKTKNGVWRLFASVKLALIILILLAGSSIIGTLIKQGQDSAYYVREFGGGLARFFEVLDIPNMYHSWWFSSLLCLFAINLIVCSIDRLPRVWQLVTLDNLNVDPLQLEKKSFTHRTAPSLEPSEALDRMHKIMSQAGWRTPRRQDFPGTILLFSQKGAWSRLGVYLVHLSVLAILCGGVAGTFFGLKAFVFLPEGRATTKVFLQKNKAPVSLGFELQCDRYTRTYYPNGMVKQHRLDLTVKDPKHHRSFQKSTIVNDPLSYRGFTFYQGDSYPMEEFFVEFSNRETGSNQLFRVAPEREINWPGTGISFRLEDIKRDQAGEVHQAKILLTATPAFKPSVIPIENNGSATIHRAGEELTISIHQLYSNLLLVIKDPGIQVVYAGCILMIVGLAICFFLSHQRIWVRITAGEEQQGSQILISGNCNKNKGAFEKRFQDLVDRLEKELSSYS